MKFLTTASYYGTGSSAVTDLLSEYDNVTSLDSSFECRIAHDVFGLSDLEYYLVDNYHRHNSSVAIKQFQRLMGIYGLDKYHKLENYPYYLGDVFKDACQEYISILAPYSYQGGCHADIYMKSDMFLFWLKVKERIFHKIYQFSPGQENDNDWLKKKETPWEIVCKQEITYVSYPREFFIEATKKFTRDIFSKVCNQNSQFLLVDQLVPASNTMRYCRYFDDIKVIVVDRDPRDLYYLEKYYWRGNVIPSDPNTFVNWYKATRAHKKYEQDNPNVVCRIQFEDLVIKYDTIVPMLEKFIGLLPATHTKAKQVFNPAVSINNIGKWRNDKTEFENIKKIENLLSDICPQLA